MPLFRPRRNRMLVTGHHVVAGDGRVGSLAGFVRSETPTPSPASRLWDGSSGRYWVGNDPREWA